MENLESDAFVFFGATGDLAYEQIFPALQAMTRRGHFDMPIIGVARSAKDLELPRQSPFTDDLVAPLSELTDRSSPRPNPQN